MGFLMREHGFNLERAVILNVFPDIIPGVESTFVRFDDVFGSLERLGLLRCAMIVMKCLDLENNLPGFLNLGEIDDEELSTD